MKFIFVLVFSVLITVSIGTLVKKQSNRDTNNLVSPLVAGAKSSNFSDNSTSNDSPVLGWQVFVNNYNGYKIKHPSSVNIKNKSNGDVSLYKTGSINLSITQNILLENEDVNTVIEKAIDKRKSELGESFSLVNPISPIALGSVTAQTYSSREGNGEYTYYYVPQEDKKYLIITNQTPNTGTVEYLTSEDIIYSLEFLP